MSTTQISTGSSQSFTASADGASFTVVTDGGGDIGFVTDENGRDIPFQGGMRRTFGPLLAGQSIRVYCQIGGVSVIDPSPSGAAGGAVGPVGGVFGLTKSNTVVLRAMLSSAELSRGRIWCLGTSVTAGAGATNASLYTANGKAFSVPMQLAKLLTGAGFKASADYTFCGHGATTLADALAFDTRVSASGTVDLAGESIGGKFFRLQGAGQNITFTPGVTFDRVEIGWALNTFAGSNVSAASNLGPAAPSSLSGTAAATAMSYQSLIVPAGSTSFTLTYAGSAAFLPKWIGTRTQAEPSIEVINAGWGGSKITGVAGTNWLGNDGGGAGWGALTTQANLDTSVPNVFILDSLINDAVEDPGVSTYTAALAQWIALLQTKGEVYFRIPSTPAHSTDGQAFNVDRKKYKAYADAAKATCLAAGIVVADHRFVSPDWVLSNALGKFRDGFHPTLSGYSAEAEQLRDMCVAAASL